MDCKGNCLHCTDKCNTKSNTNQHGNCELKDEEIIKALEHCSSSDLGECRNCPFYEQCENDEQLVKYALDLINRQKAEIERLKQNLEEAHIDIKEHFTTFQIEQAEELKKVKSEAMKEFAEKLKKISRIYLNRKGMLTHAVSLEEIDNLVKEMTEFKE